MPGCPICPQYIITSMYKDKPKISEFGDTEPEPDPDPDPVCVD